MPITLSDQEWAMIHSILGGGNVAARPAAEVQTTPGWAATPSGPVGFPPVAAAAPDRMHDVQAVDRDGVGRLAIRRARVSLDVLVSRYKDPESRVRPDWFWMNMTNEEHNALSLSGVLSALEVAQMTNYYFAGNGSRWYTLDPRVSHWKNAGYPCAWQEWLKGEPAAT